VDKIERRLIGYFFVTVLFGLVMAVAFVFLAFGPVGARTAVDVFLHSPVLIILALVFVAIAAFIAWRFRRASR